MSTKNYPPLVLNLVDRKPSSFILKGTEDTQQPERLDVSSNFLLLNFSYVLVPGKKAGDAKVQKTTRWIAGCDEIFIDKQKEMKVEYNPMRDIIVFEFGTLTVTREGDKVGLYDFLKSYDGNGSNPDRPKDVPVNFIEINTEVEVELRMNINELSEALAIISAHVKGTKGANGLKVYEYNYEKLRWLCKLFNLSTGEAGGDMVEALIAKANANPTLFVQTVEDVESDIKVVIITAREVGIISLDGDKAILADDQSIIIPLKGKAMNEKIKELVDYLGSPEGELMNSALRTKVEFYKSEQLKKK